MKRRGATHLMMTRGYPAVALCVGLLGTSTVSCRGHLSKRPPIRVMHDMTQQAHILPQSSSCNPVMPGTGLSPLEGTVASEQQVEPDPLETGRNSEGYLVRVPVRVDQATVQRGRDRFNIYCSGCHDQAGSGQSIMAQRGFPGPIDLASDNTRRLADGEVFSIISKGIRNMPPVGEQIAVADRWSIVVWMRVLQRSQHALLTEVQPIADREILPEEVNP